jgi:hypothetical protein
MPFHSSGVTILLISQLFRKAKLLTDNPRFYTKSWAVSSCSSKGKETKPLKLFASWDLQSSQCPTRKTLYKMHDKLGIPAQNKAGRKN